MNTPLQPNLLRAFEAVSIRRVRLWGGVFLGIWMLWGVADWGCRFGLFHWQQAWISDKPTVPAKGAGATSMEPVYDEVEAQMGSALSQMIPLPWRRAAYEDWHPAYGYWRDSAGYINPPLPTGASWRGIVVGDSFMISLGTQTFASVLGTVANAPVYNRARQAQGPFLELRRCISTPPLDPMPPYIIWNLTARELGKNLFQRQDIERWFAHTAPSSKASAPTAYRRIDWSQLQPRTLAKAWPNSSLTAYMARKSWAALRLLIFREWPQDVLGGEDPQFGPMLFYRENLRTFRTVSVADAPVIADVVGKVAQELRKRHIELIVLLVAEKEQLYTQALPEKEQPAVQTSIALLDAVATELSKRHIHRVHLLPIFQQATAEGIPVYWRDDTHWNDIGMHLAATALLREVPEFSLAPEMNP